jgi:hypothetical protein
LTRRRLRWVTAWTTALRPNVSRSNNPVHPSKADIPRAEAGGEFAPQVADVPRRARPGPR